jgi:hypothetical protein
MTIHAQRLRTALSCVAASVLAWSGAAGAQPCAGFTDVDVADPFCPSVTWMRNRGVTLGCDVALYCPTALVSRLAMAAFMQRLGAVLTPQVLSSDAPLGALDIDFPVVVCATGAVPLGSYPRTAIVDGTFGAVAPVSRILSATFVHSTDGGVSWNATSQPEVRAGAAPDQWVAVPVVGSVAVGAGTNAAFALRVSSSPGAGADVADSRCSLRVQLFDRDVP